MDETRAAYAPERWEADETGAPHEMEQVWFSGSHADVGGHLLGHEAARPWSNIPLIWMMEHAERHGLRLPETWREGPHINATAPKRGHVTWGGAVHLGAGQTAGEIIQF